MGYDKKTRMYETEYGDKISYAFTEGLNRMELRNAVLMILEEGALKNARPLKATFGDSVDSPSPTHPGSKSSGCVVPRSKWKAMLSILEFSQDSSSSEGWTRYSIGGLCSTTNPKSPQASYADLSYIEDYNWGNRTIEHSISIHYRKRDGGFTHYTGNVEDLFEQIASRMDIKRLNRDFNL